MLRHRSLAALVTIFLWYLPAHSYRKAEGKKTFAESKDILEKLADESLEEKRKGKTTPLDHSRL